jgi:hypothetical protein
MSIAGQGKRIALVTGEIEIQSLLVGLGATADEINVALRAEVVRGRRQTTNFDNPIVRYLYRHVDIGGRLDIPLGSSVLTIAREGTWLSIPLPPPVCDFLNRFHDGHYPQLEQD